MAKNIEDYEEVIGRTENETILKYATAAKELKDGKSALPEGGLYEALSQLQRLVAAGGVGGSVDEAEVKAIVDAEMKKVKLSVQNLDQSIIDALSGNVTMNVNMTLPSGASVTGKSKADLSDLKRPLVQTILCDLLAQNSVYVYGAAGTGKSYTAGLIKKAMSTGDSQWNIRELNCNQFTSPTEIIGGQTIEGYQKGELEMAWTNTDQAGKKFAGSILLLDELPKLDPNTAGVLNAALAKVNEPDEIDATTGMVSKPTIKNGRGEMLPKGNVFIYATGNAPLNEADPDYEANFKQDLSLQDRFVGSMYKVFADYGHEATMMKGMLFIFNHMMPLREAILKGEDGQSFAGKGFVSLRIILSMKRTFLSYMKQTNTPDSIVRFKPKGLRLALESFLEIFTEKQRTFLKQEMNYDAFVSVIEAKEGKTYKYDSAGYPILEDTIEEAAEAKRLIDKYNEDHKAIYQKY